MIFISTLVLLICLATPIVQAKPNSTAPDENSTRSSLKCAYISSYSPGYTWQDQLEQSLKSQLKSVCRVSTFYMDTKKIQQTSKLVEKGLEAKAFIEQLTPDIVIISDDNAAQYVLASHFRNHRTPFVFCGINNSAKPYQLPYSNTSGMLEIAPTEILLEQIIPQRLNQKHIAYLTTQGATADQNIIAFNDISKTLNIHSAAYQAQDQVEWRQLYKQLQEDPEIDIIILGNYVAFPKWDRQENIDWIQKHNQKLTVATQKWMMPYVALGMTKSATEQGAWAGKTAAAVLSGVPINLIATVPNQLFQTWINPLISEPVETKIPKNMINQARLFSEITP